jgi:multiple sugar transport system permease protein
VEIGSTGDLKMRSLQRTSRKTVPFIVAVLICIPMFLPFLWMFLSSFKNSAEILHVPQTLFPKSPTLETYRLLLVDQGFPGFFLNSAIMCVSVTVIILLSSALAGFVFAKFHFRGKETIFLIILSTLMVPFAVFVIPLFIFIAQLKWVNTYHGLILPLSVSAFGIFLMRQFMEDLPDSLFESAKIDGANEWQMFFRIAMPLSKSAFSALGIFAFMWAWNFLLWPIVVTSAPELRTLTLALAAYSLQNIGYGQRYDIMVTGAALSVIPVLIVYLIFNKNFVKGLTFTGLKY